MKSTALIVLLSLALAGVANAEVYKWVDEDGNVHFTDTPPPKQETEEVKIDRAPTPTYRSSDSLDSAGGGVDDEATARAICTKAISNLRRFAPIWVRKIRGRMDEMSPEQKAEAEAAIKEMNQGIREATSSMDECIADMKNPESRAGAECMANAPDADTAMFCVL